MKIRIENEDGQKPAHVSARHPETGKEEHLFTVPPTESLADYVDGTREIIVRHIPLAEARKREAARAKREKNGQR